MLLHELQILKDVLWHCSHAEGIRTVINTMTFHELNSGGGWWVSDYIQNWRWQGMKEENAWLAARVSQKLVKTTLFVSSPAGSSK